MANGSTVMLTGTLGSVKISGIYYSGSYTKFHYYGRRSSVLITTIIH